MQGVQPVLEEAEVGISHQLGMELSGEHPALSSRADMTVDTSPMLKKVQAGGGRSNHPVLELCTDIQHTSHGATNSSMLPGKLHTTER